MPEVRDPRIKLFGRNIHFHSQISAAAQVAMGEGREATSSAGKETPKQKDGPSYGHGGRENNLGDQEKVVKKPDKIQACPRCHSLDTKFCYFNNYNVNQPRHFCRSCHRYWTAGGTIRSVRVGSGRRKNKLPSSQTRGLPVTGSDNLSSVKNQHLSSAGVPATCESITSSLNLRDPTVRVKTGSAGNDGDEPSLSGCSSASTTVHENELPENVKEQAASMEHPMQCYPWNPMIPGISIPFIPASYWGYMPSWDSRNWNTPLAMAATSSTSNSCSDNNSPTLGKHSRDGSVEEKTEQSLWIPKTLRIDDMDEAAKSSLWDTLGIKKGDMFRAFQSKPDTNGDAQQLLQANPAAFDIL